MIIISECQEFVSEDVVSTPGAAGYGVTTHAVPVGGGHWVTVVHYWATQESNWDRTEYYLLLADGARRPIPAGSMEAAEAWVRREVAWDEARPFTATIVEKGARPFVMDPYVYYGGVPSFVSEWAEFEFDPPLATIDSVVGGTGRQPDDAPRRLGDRIRFDGRVRVTLALDPRTGEPCKIDFGFPHKLAGSDTWDIRHSDYTIVGRVEKLGYRVVGAGE